MFPRITHTRATQGPPGCGNNDEVLLPVHSIHSLTPAALSRRISVDMMGYLNVKLVFLSLSRSLPLCVRVSMGEEYIIINDLIQWGKARSAQLLGQRRRCRRANMPTETAAVNLNM